MIEKRRSNKHKYATCTRVQTSIIRLCKVPSWISTYTLECWNIYKTLEFGFIDDHL